MSIANTYEPPPSPGRGDVWLDAIEILRDGVCPQDLIELCKERRAFGIAKYGTPLQYDNGRDPVNDAMQELLDLIAYLTQADKVELLPLVVDIYDALKGDE
jgi:hypothetical protein